MVAVFSAATSSRRKAALVLALVANLPSFATAASAASSPFSIETDDDIRSTAETLAYDIIHTWYRGNESGQIPGLLPGPPDPGRGGYYWYHSAHLWNTLIDYRHYTGDESYDDIITEGILFQVGDREDFMPRNQTEGMGNEDQCQWALAALSAAESGFPNPDDDKPQWADLAKTVFNDQAMRWEYEVEEGICDGGLRWGIFADDGMWYNWKDGFSNGCFFDLASRLALYTGNKTYADQAEKTWDWMVEVGLVDEAEHRVRSGLAVVDDECGEVDEGSFSWYEAIVIHGAAVMYNYTDGSEVWQDRVEKYSKSHLDYFFENGTLVEIQCEIPHNCAITLGSTKGVTHQWLAASTQLAPFIADTILPVLRTSAQSAIDQCTGGDSGRECGFYWESELYDGYKIQGQYDEDGAAEGMSVLAAVSSLFVDKVRGPLTESEAAASNRGSNGGNNGGNNNNDSGNGGSGNSDGSSDSQDGGEEGGDDDSAAGHANMSLFAVVAGAFASAWILASN